MSANKKKHTNEDEEMKESDEDFSGEEESDEDEKISAGNEVNFVIPLFVTKQKHFVF